MPAAAAPRDRSRLAVRRHQRGAARQRVACASSAASVHVIVGPNGAGKSTLLSAMLGEIAFDGRIVAELDRRPAGSATSRRASRSIRRCRSRSPIFSRSPASGGRSASASTRRPRAPSRRLLERVGLAGPRAPAARGALRRRAAARAAGARARPGAGTAASSTSPPPASTSAAMRILDEILLGLEAQRPDDSPDGVARSRAGAPRRRPGHGARSAHRRRRAAGRHPRARPACASCCRRSASRRALAHDRLLQLDRRRSRSRASCRATSSIRSWFAASSASWCWRRSSAA